MSRYKWTVVVLVGILVIAALFSSLISITDAVPTVAQMNNLPVIIIDPGHGGIDGGAVGVDDIVEKDINLAISLALRDMFLAGGFEVVMTRDTDISIHDEGISGTRQQKTSDLKNRLALVEQYPGAVFLSIHQNKFGESSSWGTQVFYGPNNPQSQRLADILQEDMVKNLQPENKRLTKTAGKNLYLMYHANCTAVLVECGFLSNREEAYRLTDPEYQTKMAFTTFAAVMRFLEMDTPGLDADGADYGLQQAA